ncbi:hypothetical protein B0H15DRAFT_273655 [Mycena belliarum]|uniref:N-acetyltransferase domain-containing protein n=1 Tax=Mycena belliarum TaxID=1033014 RepID=A0AAD6U951_9AGAR|nr:hypothetical protein B0H15DRAFT_273655 [Mycena belliae]
MGDLVVRRLINPTDDEIERGSALLTEAFRSVTEDNFGASMTGGNPDLDQPFHRAHMRAGAIGGELWVAGFGPTDISAVAVLFGPGSASLATEEQRAAGWNEVRSRFTPELERWWSEYFEPRSAQWIEACLGKGTDYKSWHLAGLATSPNHQHKGLATALLQAVNTRASSDGTMIYLETTTDANIMFYKKHGFVVRGDISIIGSGGDTTLTCLSKP